MTDTESTETDSSSVPEAETESADLHESAVTGMFSQNTILYLLLGSAVSAGIFTFVRRKSASTEDIHHVA